MVISNGHADSCLPDNFSEPTLIEFFDSHCHFDFSEFDTDREAVWQACFAQGIKTIVVPGVAPEQWKIAATLSKSYNGIFYATGIHPWWIAGTFANKIEKFHIDSTYQYLHENLIAPGCVAVGECGLDAMVELPLSEQLKILNVHLQVASELSFPLIIHCRKAHNELLVELKKFNLPAGGVIHAFSGSIELAASYWALGFCVGIGGTITYERAHKTRDAVKQLPIAAILLETDAPDMPLHGQQGQRNSPQNIPLVAQTLADIRGESIEYVSQQTTHNAKKLFGLV